MYSFQNVNLTMKGIIVSFNVEDGTNRVISSGTIPIDNKDNEQFQPTLTKAMCEKCEGGELIFDATKEYSENSFTHSCSNCDNTEIFDKIYPGIALADEKSLDDVSAFTLLFTPIFKDDLVEINSDSNM